MTGPNGPGRHGIGEHAGCPAYREWCDGVAAGVPPYIAEAAQPVATTGMGALFTAGAAAGVLPDVRATWRAGSRRPRVRCGGPGPRGCG